MLNSWTSNKGGAHMCYIDNNLVPRICAEFHTSSDEHTRPGKQGYYSDAWYLCIYVSLKACVILIHHTKVFKICDGIIFNFTQNFFSILLEGSHCKYLTLGWRSVLLRSWWNQLRGIQPQTCCHCRRTGEKEEGGGMYKHMALALSVSQY